jgi:hypothetical protein
MKPYELIDGKLIIRDPEIIQKLNNLTEKQLVKVSEILKDDLDLMKQEMNNDNHQERE